MAHGHQGGKYQQGEYFARFLEDLPRIMMMQQQMELSERRLGIAEKNARADIQYRATMQNIANTKSKADIEHRTVVRNQSIADATATATYREDVLANSKKAQELDDFKTIYNATENADVKHLLLKQHPSAKNNPALMAQMQTSFENEQSLKDQVFGLSALTASERILESRKLVNNPAMTAGLFTLVKDAEKEGRDELQFTIKELGETVAGIEYAKLVHMFENPEQYVKAGEDVTEFMNTISGQLSDVRGEGLIEYQKSYGDYPELEDIDEEEIDNLLDSVNGEGDSGEGQGTPLSGESLSSLDELRREAGYVDRDLASLGAGLDIKSGKTKEQLQQEKVGLKKSIEKERKASRKRDIYPPKSGDESVLAYLEEKGLSRTKANIDYAIKDLTGPQYEEAMLGF